MPSVLHEFTRDATPHLIVELKMSDRDKKAGWGMYGCLIVAYLCMRPLQVWERLAEFRWRLR